MKAVQGKVEPQKLQLIIDCQVLQTSDRKRGMGFYLQSLLANVAKDRAAQSIGWIFLLNQRLPKLNAEDKKVLHSFGGRILELSLQHQGDCAVFDEAAPENRSVLSKALEPLLIDSPYDRTIFFIPAMFSREIYPVFPMHGTANLMLFYDLIPFLFDKQYLPDPAGLASQDYCQRFREFYKATQIAAISQTTADDLSVYLGVDPSRVTSIFGGAADRSGLRPKQPKIAEQLKDGFVFMPTGDDHRKNNMKAAQAFAALNAREKLVVTSNFSDGSKKILGELCPNIIFAGSVTDEEYLWLLDNAKTVFFPTSYEGLGMPILEAVERGVSITCSNIPVFAEISQTSFFYFDPDSTTSMTRALRRSFATDADSKFEQKNKKEQYPYILKKFSWQKTAELFLEAAEKCAPSVKKQKLAIFCPSPVSYSAIGKYALEVHGELSQLYDITYFTEAGQTELEPTRPNILEYAAEYNPASSFDGFTAKHFDKVLYHIGNSEFHVDTILNALRIPASAIVHDTKLNGVFDYMQQRHYLTPERREYESLLNNAFHCRKSDCLVSIDSWQDNIFCHSNYAQSAVAETRPGDRSQAIHTIALPIGVPDIRPHHTGETAISFAGIISEAKGINLVEDVSNLPNVRVKVFGYGVLGDSPLLNGLSNVEIMKDLTDKEFQDALRSSDIVINYRMNYHGETSKSTLEAMRYGATVVVKRIGWFDELPDDTVVKVENEHELLEKVRALSQQPKQRQAVGDAARQYLKKEHTYTGYAQKLKEGLER